MSLELILGSMYSGKSTELMRRVNRLTSIGMRCLVVNHTNDKRPGVQNHDGQRLEAIKTTELLLVGTGQYNVVAIDEGQFFSNLRVAVTLMVEHGKHVIVAGLNGDFQRQKFGEILDLVPYADDVTFKRALCARCRHPSRQASFTKRLDDARDVVSVDSTHIAVCRQCWQC
jgi:thymidine kinase